MSEPLKAALTAEEWSRLRGGRHEVRRPSDGALHGVSVSLGWPWTGINICAEQSTAGLDEEWCHTIAAVALYGQPFGFTHEDVAMLRTFASPPDLPAYEPLLNLANRLEALLPPEKSS